MWSVCILPLLCHIDLQFQDGSGTKRKVVIRPEINVAVQTALATPLSPSKKSHILRVVVPFPAEPSDKWEADVHGDPMAFLELSRVCTDSKWIDALNSLRALAGVALEPGTLKRKRGNC
jgi:hypothetical protein